MSNGKLPNTGTMKPMPYKPGTGRAKTLPYTPGTGRTKTMPLPYKPPVDARDVFEKAFDAGAFNKRRIDVVGPGVMTEADFVRSRRGKK